MPSPFCHCQCKMCRAPGGGHYSSHPSCGMASPSAACSTTPPLDERAVADVLCLLNADSGSHSPSVAAVERAMPGLVKIDACFLSSPYAADEVVRRLRAISPQTLDRMVSHYPSQGGAMAEMLAPSVGVSPDQLHVANGATEVIGALLADAPEPLVLSLPTFSAYYEAAGPVIPHPLRPELEFRPEFAELEALVDLHSPDTVVIINPNNPDGGLASHAALVDFVRSMYGRVKQVIVDESFGAFATEDKPPTLAPLVAEMPHLVVVDSLSKSHGIAGCGLATP